MSQKNVIRVPFTLVVRNKKTGYVQHLITDNISFSHDSFLCEIQLNGEWVLKTFSFIKYNVFITCNLACHDTHELIPANKVRF